MFELTPFRSAMLPRTWFQDFFGDGFAGLSPMRADILEEGENLVIEAELPGFNKDEIKINVKDNHLTISAERSQAKEEKSETYLRRERSLNQVCRTFIIEDLDPDKIEASFQDGLLRLTLPKPEELEPKTKTIDIK